MATTKIEFITWDWKSRPYLKDLQKLLEPFGLYVYEDPWMKGTDGYGFIVSNVSLTDQELYNLSQEQWGEE